jgi:lysophospholipase L1-like esterase
MDRPENLSLRDKIEWIIKELRKLKRGGGGSSSETNPGLSTTYTKTETDYLLQKLESELVSGLKGDLKITDTAPTAQGLYILSDVGTYTNLGGLVTTAGKLNFASFDGTSWSLIAIDIPKGADGKTIEDWSAKAFPIGSSVYMGGEVYNNPTTAATSADIPSVSAVWVRKVNELFVSGLPIENNPIREIYIDGWTSGNLYLNILSVDVNNKVEVWIRNVDTNTDVLIADKVDKTDVIKLSERNTSGLSGYIAIDWNAFTANISGTNEKKYRISPKAKKIVNTPIISAYIDSLNFNAKVAVAPAVASNTALITSRLPLSGLGDNQFIKELYITGWNDPTADLYLMSFNAADGATSDKVTFIIRNKTTNADVIYTYQKVKGLDIYALENAGSTAGSGYGGYIAIDWNKYKAAVHAQGLYKYQINPMAKDIKNSPYIDSYLNVKPLLTDANSENYLTNVLPYDLADSANGITSKIGTNNGFTVTQQTDGLRFQATYNGTTASSVVFDNVITGLLPNKTYAIVSEITYNAMTALSPDIFELRVTNNSLISSLIVREPSSDIISKKRRIYKCTLLNTSGSVQGAGKIEFKAYNNNSATGIFFDAVIHKLMIIEVKPATTVKTFNNEYFISLVKQVGYFQKLVQRKSASSVPNNGIYYGKKLKSLGDSLPETRVFQPLIANHLGMFYDSTEEITDVNDGGTIRYRSTRGSTSVVPVVTSYSTGGRLPNYSIYMRAKSLSYWNPDVLLILAGYNDTAAGQPYIAGGTAVEPADYGLNDAAYTGGEIDLVANPSATVPSFGASYRGMLQQIFTDMPSCRVVLIAPPRGSGGANPTSGEYAIIQGKTKVIQQIAKEFGCPFVSLADTYGVNQWNHTYLTKDGLHFGFKGGERVAMEILKVF